MRKPLGLTSGGLGRRWRGSVAVLIAIVIGGAGVASAVKAADSASIGVSLHAQQVGAARTICVGDSVQIRVSVNKVLGKRAGLNTGLMIGRLAGVTVTAAFFGSTRVGTISPLSSPTSVGSNPPGTTYFSFTAERAGIGGIAFTARVPDVVFLGFVVSNKTIKTQTQVTVEDCKYRISATSTWRVPGEARITILAQVKFAGLVEDGGGHYSGTARVQWIVSTAQVRDCQATIPPDSQAAVEIQVLAFDEMIATIDYETATVPLIVNCGDAGGTRDVDITPDLLPAKVHPTGGQKSRQHGLLGPEGPILGSAVVIVKRATGQ